MRKQLLVTVGIDEEMGKSNDIRAAVIDDLTFDPDVDASDIRVEEMDGDVVLTGSVPSYPQYVQAAGWRLTPRSPWAAPSGKRQK
jgi:osmotically-inducible protein OsmY